MRWLKSSLAATALAAGIVLAGAGTASAAEIRQPTAPHRAEVQGVDAAADEWRWGGHFGNQITCNLEGAWRVAFTSADDYQCLPPGGGSSAWVLMLHY